jgi:hypothetical protein
MGIKCSLLGHRFDDTTVEREREEDGTEVVITIKELETCQRCGETRVVSENKEVTTLETPDDDFEEQTDTADDTEPSEDTASSPTADTSTEPTDEAFTDDGDSDLGPMSGEGDDAEIIEDTTDSGESDAQAEARGGADPEIPDAEGGNVTVDTGEDDAVIIDDTDSDRDPGEWPDDDTDDDPVDADTAVETDAGVETNPADETDSVAEGDAVEPGTQEWPEATRRDEPEPESEVGDWPEDTIPADNETQILSGADDAVAAISVPEGMFKCSECGFTTEADSSSLRAGDFCPECRRGTLVEHTDETE